jgi:hypothetical protein
MCQSHNWLRHSCIPHGNHIPTPSSKDGIKDSSSTVCSNRRLKVRESISRLYSRFDLRYWTYIYYLGQYHSKPYWCRPRWFYLGMCKVFAWCIWCQWHQKQTYPQIPMDTLLVSKWLLWSLNYSLLGEELGVLLLLILCRKLILRTGIGALNKSYK